MGNKVRVQKTSNQQYTITLPKAIAELFDYRQGTVLEFKISEKGELTLKRVKS